MQTRIGPYLRPGIDTESQQQLLSEVATNIPGLKNLLEPHPLKDGFLVDPHNDRQAFLSCLAEGQSQSPLIDTVINAIGFDQEDPAAVERFKELLSAHSEITTFASWWDDLPYADFSIVGDVIAFVNVRRHMEINNAKTVGQLLAIRSS